MTKPNDKRKAAAKCLTCGEISAVEVERDGSISPIGQPALCQCDDPDVALLEGNDALDDSNRSAGA